MRFIFLEAPGPENWRIMLLHHVELLEQPVDLLDLHARAGGDAALAAVVEAAGFSRS